VVFFSFVYCEAFSLVHCVVFSLVTVLHRPTCVFFNLIFCFDVAAILRNKRYIEYKRSTKKRKHVTSRVFAQTTNVVAAPHRFACVVTVDLVIYSMFQHGAMGVDIW